MMSLFDFPDFGYHEPPLDVIFWSEEPTTGKKVATPKPRNEEFRLALHVQNYKPDELKVNLDGRILVVEGEHEEKAEDGSYSFTSNFHRRVLVPRHIDLDSITTALDDKGLLCITAKPKPLEEKKELKSIPIGLKTIEDKETMEQ